MNLRNFKRSVSKSNGSFEGATDRKIRLAREAQAKKDAEAKSVEPTTAEAAS